MSMTLEYPFICSCGGEIREDDCCHCGDTRNGWDHKSMDGHDYVSTNCLCYLKRYDHSKPRSQ